MTRKPFVLVLLATLLLPLGGARADEPQDPPPPRCEMASCSDPLFTVQYPYNRSVVTSTNVRIHAPVRYYDFQAAAFIGHGDLATMQDWTAGTGYRPVRTESGFGVAALWAIRYLDTDIAPYDEAITSFAVSTEDVTIPDTPGAMLAAFLDPENRIWIQRLILSEELPIVAGREFAFIPKEPEPKSMWIDLADPEAVSLTFIEPDGTPIVLGDLRFDPATLLSEGQGLATAEGTRRVGTDLAGRAGNWRLRTVFRNIEQPEATATLEAIGKFSDPSALMFAECCDGSMWFNAETAYGADLAALDLDPRAVFVVRKGGRMVLDLTLS